MPEMTHRFYVLALFVLIAISILQRSLTVADDTSPAAMKKEFDETSVAWQDDQARMLRGFRLAEDFRQMLFKVENGTSRAQTIAEGLERFRIDSKRPLPNRPTLDRFKVTAKSFLKQIQGRQKLNAQAAFASFSGRWYGKWDQLLVDHNWHPVVADLNSLKVPETLKTRLVGLQYAWIGDGFGWNYVGQSKDGEGQFILGYVYHLAPREPKKIRYESPLVGYFDGPGRLIWVTPHDLFLEEVLPGKTKSEDRYAITGFRYRIAKGHVVPEGDGFQAIYSRNSKQRSPWMRFDVQKTKK